MDTDDPWNTAELIDVRNKPFSFEPIQISIGGVSCNHEKAKRINANKPPELGKGWTNE